MVWRICGYCTRLFPSLKGGECACIAPFILIYRQATFRRRGNHMSTTRREFLVRALIGAGAVTGTEQPSTAEAQNALPAQAHAAERHGAFFNHDDAATI